MQRIPFITKDGSHSIKVDDSGLTYHSFHGAIGESMHVYIQAGLRYILDQKIQNPVSILEMGFGTGLNALLTCIEAASKKTLINYTSIEAFPLEKAITDQLNYCHQLNRDDCQQLFTRLHACKWGEQEIISEFFHLLKLHESLIDCTLLKKFDLVYYDAFAPGEQPEMWTKEIFEKLFGWLNPDGILVTYCSKSDMRRAMQAAGFKVEKIQGPHGKREMVRAKKLMANG